MGYAKTLTGSKLTRYRTAFNPPHQKANSSAKSIAELKKGGLDETIPDVDHRKAIVNAAKRVLKVYSKPRVS